MLLWIFQHYEMLAVCLYIFVSNCCAVVGINIDKICCIFWLKLGYGLDSPGFESRQGQEICLFSKTVDTGSGADPLTLQGRPRCNVRTFDSTYAAGVGAPYGCACINDYYTLKRPPSWAVVET